MKIEEIKSFIEEVLDDSMSSPGETSSQKALTAKLEFDETFGIPPEFIPKIEQWGQFVFSKLKFLGGGSMGMAYATEDGRVVKFTQDQTEAEASQNLIGRKHSNITTYHKIAQINPNDWSFPIYVIIQEKLPLSPSDVLTAQQLNIIDELFKELNLSSINIDLEKRDAYQKYLDYSLNLNVEGGELTQESAMVIEDFMNEIFDGLEFLDMNGIEYRDVWLPNIMFRNEDTPVIIDLGYSVSVVNPDLYYLKERRI